MSGNLQSTNCLVRVARDSTLKLPCYPHSLVRITKRGYPHLPFGNSCFPNPKIPAANARAHTRQATGACYFTRLRPTRMATIRPLPLQSVPNWVIRPDKDYNPILPFLSRNVKACAARLANLLFCECLVESTHSRSDENHFSKESYG